MEPWNRTEVEHLVLGSIVLAYTVYSAILEVIQFAAASRERALFEALSKHFDNVWNWIDLANIGCLFYICAQSLFFRQGGVSPLFWAV